VCLEFGADEAPRDPEAAWVDGNEAAIMRIE